VFRPSFIVTWLNLVQFKQYKQTKVAWHHKFKISGLQVGLMCERSEHKKIEAVVRKIVAFCAIRFYAICHPKNIPLFFSIFYFDPNFLQETFVSTATPWSATLSWRWALHRWPERFLKSGGEELTKSWPNPWKQIFYMLPVLLCWFRLHNQLRLHSRLFTA